VKRINPFMESVKLSAESMLSCFQSVQEKDVGPSLGDTTEGPRQRPPKGRGTVPPYVKKLYEAACDGCASIEEYNDLFSSRDHDVGLTRAIRHGIPLAAGTVPIRQPTHRLRSDKEKEVSQQVRDLLNRGLIQPAHSA